MRGERFRHERENGGREELDFSFVFVDPSHPTLLYFLSRVSCEACLSFYRTIYYVLGIYNVRGSCPPHLRDVQAEGVEGNEHPLINHHGARTVRLADVRVGRITVDGVSARQVLRVCVDRRVDGHTGADPQDENACNEGLGTHARAIKTCLVQAATRVASEEIHHPITSSYRQCQPTNYLAPIHST